MSPDELHAARLVLAQAAALALLHEAQEDAAPNSMPDGITITVDSFGGSVEYTRVSQPVAGERL